MDYQKKPLTVVFLHLPALWCIFISTFSMMNLRAYAKINIGLRVLGRRPDGYHDIETVFHQIDWYDEITLERAENGITFSTDLPRLENNSNLCVRAAQLLQSKTSTHAGAIIHLRKSIPIGAGLGGGSSDAAAVLKGLNALWNLNLSDEQLAELSIELGADVPFFLHGGTAFGRGRGEILERIEIPMPYWILVCTPHVHVSTAWAYSKFKPDPGILREDIRSIIARTAPHFGKFRNDFEPIVFRAYPEIRKLKEELRHGGAQFAMMSGSGSSVFGLFRNETNVRSLARELANRYSVSITEPFFKPEPVHTQS